MNKSKIVNAGSSKYRTVNPKYWVDLNFNPGSEDGDTSDSLLEITEKWVYTTAKHIGALHYTRMSGLESFAAPNAETFSGNFGGNNTLKNVEFPKLKEIGASAFASCGVEKYYFPSVEVVNNNAFSGSQSIYFCDFHSVKQFKEVPFGGCSNFKVLIIRTTSVCEFTSPGGVFSGAAITTTKTGYIYVPRSLLSEYETKYSGSPFSTQFRSIEDYTVDGTTMGALDESKI